MAAYRKAAAALRELPDKAGDILETSGVDGLATLPAVGPNLARAIAEIIETRSLGLLERLEGEAPAAALFGTVPGIGPSLASRIHEELGIETLEELEAAAHDGRLATVRGFGPKRILGVTEVLAGRLGNRSRRRSAVSREVPPVSELLDVDREYREKAGKDAFVESPPAASTPRDEHGFPSFIPPAARGTTPRSSRTRRSLTSTGRRTTGWSCSKMTGSVSARRRW